jgi:hypothetical protein
VTTAVASVRSLSLARTIRQHAVSFPRYILHLIAWLKTTVPSAFADLADSAKPHID